MAQLRAAAEIGNAGDVGGAFRSAVDGEGRETEYAFGGIVTTRVMGHQQIAAPVPPTVDVVIVVIDAQRQRFGGDTQQALDGDGAFQEGADVAFEVFAELFHAFVGAGRQAVEGGEAGQVVDLLGATVGVVHPVSAHDSRQTVLRPLQFTAEGIDQRVERRRPGQRLERARQVA